MKFVSSNKENSRITAADDAKADQPSMEAWA